MAILSLLAKLGLDKTGFDAGMSAAGKQVSKFGADLKGSLAGAFGTAALAALAKETIAYGDSIKELGERLGITNQEAQQFAIAAKLGGADMEFFASKFDKLKKAMSVAISGGNNPFAAFGISAEKLSQLRPSDVIQRLADQINGVGLAADQQVKFIDIFGKGAGRMINILGDLENAKVGTLIFSDREIKQLNEADDALTKLWNNTKVGASRTVDLLSTVVSLISKFISGGKISDVFQKQQKAPKAIDESQLLTDLEAADEQRKVHMAIMDRVLALDREAAKLEREAAMAGMTDLQKKNKLLQERATLMENLRTMVGDLEPGEEEARAMMRKRLAEVNLDVAQIDRQKAVTPASAIPHIESTRLGAIGGTLGGTGIRTEQMAAENLRVLKEVKEILGRRGIVIAPNGWR